MKVYSAIVTLLLCIAVATISWQQMRYYILMDYLDRYYKVTHELTDSAKTLQEIATEAIERLKVCRESYHK